MKSIVSVAEMLDSIVRNPGCREDYKVAMLLKRYWPLPGARPKGLTLRQFECLWKSILNGIRPGSDSSSEYHEPHEPVTDASGGGERHVL